MQVKFTSKGTTLIAIIVGELDHHSAEHIRTKIDNEMMKATVKNLIFDFSKVTFMDSSGIGVIMGRYKNVNKLNGKVMAVNLSEQIKRIFEMSGIQRFIPLYKNIDAAINNI